MYDLSTVEKEPFRCIKSPKPILMLMMTVCKLMTSTVNEAFQTMDHNIQNFKHLRN